MVGTSKAAKRVCRGAVAFLAQEASTRDYRLDAVHLGILLLHYGVLGASSEQDAGGCESVM